MMETHNKQSLFEAIKAVSNDNAQLFNLSGIIFNDYRAKSKQLTELQSIHAIQSALLDNQTTQEPAIESETTESEPMRRPPLPDDATDAEIRTRARMSLMDKLNDNTITAPEFAQFKDVFGLASAENDLNIRVISYRDICEGCPIGAEPAPIEPDHAA